MQSSVYCSNRPMPDATSLNCLGSWHETPCTCFPSTSYTASSKDYSKFATLSLTSQSHASSNLPHCIVSAACIPWPQSTQSRSHVRLSHPIAHGNLYR